MSVLSFGNLATATTAVSFSDAADERVRFQTFTLHEPATLNYVLVKLRDVSPRDPWERPSDGGASNVLVSLRNVVDGMPGAVEYAAGYIPGVDIDDRVIGTPLEVTSAPTFPPPLPSLPAGQYALVFTLESPVGVQYELAVVPARTGEHLGRYAPPAPIGPFPSRGRWVDESSLGCAWVQLSTQLGYGELVDVTNSSRTGSGFGNALGEVARYQTFYATHASQTVHGVDVRVRRAGIGRQSDVVVHLHGTAGGLPTGDPMATAFIPATSIGLDWVIVHADLRCTGLAPDTPYAVVLTQRSPRAEYYEWARAEVDGGLRCGKWTGRAWVDESASGDAWLRIWGGGAFARVRGDHAGTTGLGFGNAVDEVLRYQLVDVTPFGGKPTWGVDLKLRRAFGTAQSDLVVGLYRTSGGYPTGAPFETLTVPASRIADVWTVVHVPLWHVALPAGAIAIVVGQAVPQAARYEWAVGHAAAYHTAPGKFGKRTPAGWVDESHFGTGWFTLWSDPYAAATHDVSAAPTAWYGFGNAADEVKRFETVAPAPSGWRSLVGVELRLRKAFGAGQSDVVVQLYRTANRIPAGNPITAAVIPSSAVSADVSGSTHRVMIPFEGYGGGRPPFAIVLGQRTPQTARYEWATGPNLRGQAFGKWNGTTWVDETPLGAGSTRAWLRR